MWNKRDKGHSQGGRGSRGRQVRGGAKRKRMGEERRERRRNGMRKTTTTTRRRRRGRSMSGVEEGAAC